MTDGGTDGRVWTRETNDSMPPQTYTDASPAIGSGVGVGVGVEDMNKRGKRVKSPFFHGHFCNTSFSSSFSQGSRRFIAWRLCNGLWWAWKHLSAAKRSSFLKSSASCASCSPVE
jgi:hypothetical protein